jgi:hypothetical protein
MRRVAMVLFAVGYAGCAPTRFYGSPRLENGPAGCRASCDAWGMELGGMVKMGEYSEGCICLVKPDASLLPRHRRHPRRAPTRPRTLGATAGARSPRRPACTCRCWRPSSKRSGIRITGVDPRALPASLRATLADRLARMATGPAVSRAALPWHQRDRNTAKPRRLRSPQGFS